MDIVIKSSRFLSFVSFYHLVILQVTHFLTEKNPKQIEREYSNRMQNRIFRTFTNLVFPKLFNSKREVK